MWGLIVLVALALVTMHISRNNYQKRAVMLSVHLKEYSTYLKDTMDHLPPSEQDLFIDSLDESSKAYLKALLRNHNLNYGNNVWTIQQHMSKQQELLGKLKTWHSSEIK